MTEWTTLSWKIQRRSCNLDLIVIRKAMVRQGISIHNGENRVCVENKKDGTYRDRALGNTGQERGEGVDRVPFTETLWKWPGK